MLLFLIGRGIVLGFSAASVPGPLQAYVINTSLKSGWQQTLYIIVAPLVVDIPIIVAVLLALDALEDVVPQIINVIRIIGGFFVLYLAWGALQDFRHDRILTESPEELTSTSMNGFSVFGRAMLLNLLSPGPYLFWTTVSGPLLKQALETSIGHGAAFLIAFYSTFLGGFLFIAVFIDWIRHMGQSVARGILVFTILLLVGLGVWLIVEGVTAFASV